MSSNGNLIIPAGLFIGLGLGVLFHNHAAGIFIGLGAGFLLRFVFSLFENKLADKQNIEGD
ncbi:hypothetical protein [Sediminibacillus halophilus]|uniref:Uncharacterized protein n=1 Tax=Sediminibacillus halophilus TaxID=482461 RepID=A0A1G9P604_9BACI|nr:hypothetical protein [Sediminibacillus halophilus]SDL94322.1 hypothetical protein SAMN05216244_1306 [Sediminibacillus halophilus]